MSDVSRGEGWWLASDQKWYPPEQAADDDIDAAIEATIPEKHRSALKAAVTSDVREIITSPFSVYLGRIQPSTVRGAGIVLVADAGIAIIDVGPKGERVRAVPTSTVASVDKVAEPFGGTSVVMRITTSDGSATELISTQRSAELLDQMARLANPANLTGMPWWLRPTVRYPAGSHQYDYVGGLAGADRERHKILATFDSTGLHLRDPGATFKWEHHLNWDDVREIAVEGSDQVKTRITVTRLLAVNLLALAWRKKEQTAFLVLDIGDGEVILASRKKTVLQLRTEFGSLIAAASADERAMSAPSQSSPTAADRLRQLQELFEQGLITQNDFDEKRQSILNEL